MCRPLLALALILTFWYTSISALTPEWHRDKLYSELFAAERTLSDGQPRLTVISNLTTAIKAELNSRLVPFTEALIADLKATHERTKTLSFAPDDIRRHPHKYLSETRLSSLYLSVRRTSLAADQLAQSSPDDPAVLLLKQGRSSIPLLIDLLPDNSIARTGRSIGFNGSTPQFMRVHPVAMHLIEELSGCDFLLRPRSASDHARIAAHVREWWGRNKDRSLEEGIRDELDSAYRAAPNFDQRHDGLIWMAQNLVASPRQPHSAYGQQILEDMVRSRRSMEAAAILARLGSRKPFEILRKRLDAPGGNPSRVWTHAELSFLMKHGGPEEWQSIYELAQSEIQWHGQVPDISDGPNRAGVLPVLVENSDRNPLWIVPCLALALDQTKLFHTDRFYAAEAVEALQEVTGEKFGFDRDASVESRLDAVEKARNWWNQTGKATYSFARISALWQKMTPPDQSTSPNSRLGQPVNQQIVPDGLYEFRWPLKLDERALQSGESKASPAKLTDMVVRTVNNQVTCIKSSNSKCIGAKGAITSEGQGRFVFRLPIPGYEELSHRWSINIDESFTVEDRDGTALVKPLNATNAAGSTN